MFKNEPQSYVGRPPGLTTRLFLRLGVGAQDAFCHLIYPASTPWHAKSDTLLELTDARGAKKVADFRASLPDADPEKKLWPAELHALRAEVIAFARGFPVVGFAEKTAKY